jgi:RNA polymerase sigma-70 factor (ECF subfamily)
MDGNRNLFWKLVKPEHLRARAFCRKLMGNREDGDDLYQDSLVTALTRFADLRDEALLKPWFYRIMVNGFKNRIRTPWWNRKAPLTSEIEETVGGADPTVRYAARRRLERAFRAVSAEERAMITLFELQGWSAAELARLYGKTEGNIKVRLSRARRKMRKALVKQSPSRRTRKTRETQKTHENVETFEGKDRICVATKPGEN